MPLTKFYQQVKDSVVRVVAQGENQFKYGTGSIIEPGNIVLTCAHCTVADWQMLIAHPSNPTLPISAKIIFSDPVSDIALLELPQSVGTPVKLFNSTSCAIGNGAFVVGHPRNVHEQMLLSAHIASITSQFLVIDAPVNRGNSGGPLFNLAGEQIGVIRAKFGGLSEFLNGVKQSHGALGGMVINGIDPIAVFQSLIDQMEENLNLGIGYAIPTSVIKPLHPLLNKCISA